MNVWLRWAVLLPVPGYRWVNPITRRPQDVCSRYCGARWGVPAVTRVLSRTVCVQCGR